MTDQKMLYLMVAVFLLLDLILLKLTDSLCHSRAGPALSASRMGGNPLKFSVNWIPVPLGINFTGMTKCNILLSNRYLSWFSILYACAV